MSEAYDDLEREYDAHVSRIRSFLAATRSQSTVKECQRLLQDAEVCAKSLQDLASPDNPIQVRASQERFDKDLAPLRQEVSRALGMAGGDVELMGDHGYQAPDPYFGVSADTELLIQNSEDLLRESQALCADSERVGNSTLEQMGMQREQLQSASSRAEQARHITMQARRVLRQMGNRALRSKMFLYGVIVFLIVANIFAFIHLVKKNKKKL